MVKIEDIEKGSVAERAGIKPGSYLISIDGQEINDSLDLKFYESDNSMEILISHNDEENKYYIQKEPGVSLGIKPEEIKIKMCNNRCNFCFIDQNPPDVRESLKIKDDDYRLSFLYGNYITLTNMSGKDMDRITELNLSPLYVSVHVTDDNKRVEIMKNPDAANIMENLKKLTRSGIEVHTQVVLMPGINDGEYLNDTIEDLLDLHPGVASIGIVPVGLTDYRTNLPYIETPNTYWMEEIIDMVIPYQEEMIEIYDRNVVYLSDEFYLKTGTRIPEREHYDNYPQLENGVGMVRKFLDGMERMKIPDIQGSVLLVTGTLAAEIIYQLAQKFKEANIDTRVMSVKNRYFGQMVEVASLLGGWDLLGLLSIHDVDKVILPPDIVNRDNLFIDGCPMRVLESSLPMEFYVAPYDITELENII